jgi:hypothetical protein
LNGHGVDQYDPDARTRRIERVVNWLGAHPALLCQEDPEEILQMRLKAKVYLARYARIDPFAWEQRDVNELYAYFLEVSRLVGEENELSRRREE